MTTTFTYCGELLMRQSDGTTTLDFFYDASGTALGFTTDWLWGYTRTYHYIRNLQGDVERIVRDDGDYDMYSYDAYGNDPTWGTYGIYAINPIRYRGYYYDAETGYYFLQTRYYNPEWRRFLNADCLFIAGDALTAANMYAYCDGNPVTNVDPSGMFGKKIHYDWTIEWAYDVFIDAGYTKNKLNRMQKLSLGQIWPWIYFPVQLFIALEGRAGILIQTKIRTRKIPGKLTVKTPWLMQKRI